MAEPLRGRHEPHVGVSALEALMARVEAAGSPAEFLAAVSNAYHAASAPGYERELHALFRTSGSHDDFKRSLEIARARLGRAPAILDFGCGAGYDLEVLGEVFAPGEVRSVVCCDLSPEMLARARARVVAFPCRFVLGSLAELQSEKAVDLVVTHSLVHHLPDLAAFFGALRGWLDGGGVYVMGHEPNRRYWEDPECRVVRESLERRLRRRKRLARSLTPRRYLNKLLRMIGRNGADDLEAQVNLRLQRDQVCRGALSQAEIQALVDIHVPSPDGPSLGARGFECEEIHARYLPDFQLVSFRTSGFLGFHNPAVQPPRWRRAAARLAALSPSHGSNFSAVWQKQA